MGSCKDGGIEPLFQKNAMKHRDVSDNVQEVQVALVDNLEIIQMLNFNHKQEKGICLKGIAL